MIPFPSQMACIAVEFAQGYEGWALPTLQRQVYSVQSSTRYDGAFSYWSSHKNVKGPRNRCPLIGLAMSFRLLDTSLHWTLEKCNERLRLSYYRTNVGLHTSFVEP